MLSVCTKLLNLRNNLKYFETVFHSIVDQRLSHLTCSMPTKSILRNKRELNFSRHTHKFSPSTNTNVPTKCDESEPNSSCDSKLTFVNKSNNYLDTSTSDPTDLSIVQSPKQDGVDAITSSDLSIIKQTEKGALDPCDEDVSDIAPFVMPSFNLAAYANKSDTLQQLIHMGVDLHKVENMKGAGELLLKLDFEKDIKMHLRFLHDQGLPAEEFGYFVTKNPFIFEQSLDDLEVRINYLEAKKFTEEQIMRIIFKHPFWLNYSTVEIDKRLGFFQRTFVLSGDEVRQVAAKQPRLITHNLSEILKCMVAVREDMGFEELETKTLLINKPKLFVLKPSELKERFDYVHNIMKISHEQLLQQPIILTFRPHIIKQRYEFLKSLGKTQFDPKLPGYISLDALSTGTDVDFCKHVAKTTIEVFNAFLKTL